MENKALVESVKSVNDMLLAGEPHNISVDEMLGYVGYKPQYLIDAMNDIFGLGAWGFEELSNDVGPGEKGAVVVSQVRVWLKGVEFQPTSWGQSRVTRGDVGDAKKGAQTDALKKGLSYFSIGNRAYQGGLKQDAHPAANAQQKRTPPQAARPQVNTVPVQPESLGGLKIEVPPTPAMLMTRLGKLYNIAADKLQEKWEAFKRLVLGDETVTDAELKPHQIAQLHGAIIQRENGAQEKKQSSKAA